jgi:hypothetical protein
VKCISTLLSRNVLKICSHEAEDEEDEESEDDMDPRNIVRRRKTRSKSPEMNQLHVGDSDLTYLSLTLCRV